MTDITFSQFNDFATKYGLKVEKYYNSGPLMIWRAMLPNDNYLTIGSKYRVYSIVQYVETLGIRFFNIDIWHSTGDLFSWREFVDSLDEAEEEMEYILKKFKVFKIEDRKEKLMGDFNG